MKNWGDWRWLNIQQSPSARASQHENASDVELVETHKYEPIATISTYERTDLRSAAEALSPKRHEDAVRNRLEVDGWRFGAGLAAITATITLLINVGIGIWASTLAGFQNIYNQGILVEVYHGSCQKASSLNTWSHLAINIVSTGLLAGSNYCMQCLVAPTRAEIDAAHSQSPPVWLDIGLPSLRNLKNIDRTRYALWILLAVSSLPLHLLFNSAFFSSIGATDYGVVLTTTGFLEPDFDIANLTASRVLDAPEEVNHVYTAYSSDPSSFERLDNDHCIQMYEPDYITSRRNVIILTSDGRAEQFRNRSEIILASQQAYLADGISYSDDTQNQWICNDMYEGFSDDLGPYLRWTTSGYCPTKITRGDYQGDGWRPGNTTADGCLSQVVDEQCGFYANIAIIWIVVVCNTVKAVVMAYLVFGPVISHPLMTLGDAIVSFVIEPDDSTAHLGPTSISLVKKKQKHDRRATPQLPPEAGQHLLPHEPPRRSLSTNPSQQENQASEFHWQPTSKTIRYARAASTRRWICTISYFALCLLAIAVLLYYALNWAAAYSNFNRSEVRSKSLSALYSVGLGKIIPDHLIVGWTIENMDVQRAVISSVLIANLPQLAFSFLYFAVNTLITSMASSREWTRFSVARALKHQPKALRTSAPTGSQQRTYFLQVPFRFAVPMIALSALLHWLISQSIFLATVGRHRFDGSLVSAFFVATCGYSPIGMVYVLTLGSAMILLLLGAGCLSMIRGDGMPIVGSCSAAIAANCRVDWRRPEESFGGLDPVSRMGREARLAMLRGPIVWGELVGDGDRLAFRTAGVKDSGKKRQENETPAYGFVSATGEDWKERVRQPSPRKSVRG